MQTNLEVRSYCPTCKSDRIEKSVCLSCGMVFDKHLTVNYADIKHHYFLSLPTWAKLYPFFEKKKSQAFKIFQLRTYQRARAILQLLPKTEGSQRSLLILEWLNITSDLKKYGVSLNKLKEDIANSNFSNADLNLLSASLIKDRKAETIIDYFKYVFWMQTMPGKVRSSIFVLGLIILLVFLFLFYFV